MNANPQEPWTALRSCWSELRSSEARALGDEPLFQDLRLCHTQALDALLATGELTTDVADKVRVAFEQMLAHREGCMSMCYIAFPAEYFPRQDLMDQIATLEEMAGNSDLDPVVVAQLREALGRNIAWLAHGTGSHLQYKRDQFFRLTTLFNLSFNYNSNFHTLLLNPLHYV